MFDFKSGHNLISGGIEPQNINKPHRFRSDHHHPFRERFSATVAQSSLLPGTSSIVAGYVDVKVETPPQISQPGLNLCMRAVVVRRLL